MLYEQPPVFQDPNNDSGRYCVRLALDSLKLNLCGCEVNFRNDSNVSRPAVIIVTAQLRCHVVIQTCSPERVVSAQVHTHSDPPRSVQLCHGFAWLS